MREQEIMSRLDQGIAIIKLPVFQNNSRQRILLELAKLEAPISGLVIDLRDNPGGVLESAVDIAGLFMANTDVVQIEGRKGVERTLTTAPKALLEGLPVVILQNRYSASAAEVLASSLQTQKRAKIVGEISYGKGSVQSVIPVNDEQAIKLTVAHYLTADGRQIDDIGVTPDVRLDEDEDENQWEARALAIILAQPRPAGMKFVLKSAQ
jgi:carboxyl-terminal processing protease